MYARAENLWGSLFYVCHLFHGSMCMPCYVHGVFHVHVPLASVHRMLCRLRVHCEFPELCPSGLVYSLGSMCTGFRV